MSNVAKQTLARMDAVIVRWGKGSQPLSVGHRAVLMEAKNPRLSVLVMEVARYLKTLHR